MYRAFEVLPTMEMNPYQAFPKSCTAKWKRSIWKRWSARSSLIYDPPIPTGRAAGDAGLNADRREPAGVEFLDAVRNRRALSGFETDSRRLSSGGRTLSGEVLKAK